MSRCSMIGWTWSDYHQSPYDADKNFICATWVGGPHHFAGDWCSNKLIKEKSKTKKEKKRINIVATPTIKTKNLHVRWPFFAWWAPSRGTNENLPRQHGGIGTFLQRKCTQKISIRKCRQVIKPPARCRHCAYNSEYLTFQDINFFSRAISLNIFFLKKIQRVIKMWNLLIN